VSGEVHIRAKLTPPAGQDSLFSAPAAAEVEDTLSGDALKAVLAQEDEFNKGKGSVADIYKVGKELGRGAFAVVKECQHKQSGRKYAVKIIDRNAMGDTNELSLQREIQIMQKVDHPNIIALRQVFEDKKHVYLVMELVTGGELFDKIVEKGNYTEADAAELTRLIVGAIGYLHEKDIAHRDLKPENLLLKHKGTATDVKIADFGLSRMVNEAAMMKTAW
jgi:calcium/calmodulin-dependent protein kinase I